MGGLIDRYGRILKYLRISITDRCNFRCRYCMPPEGITWHKHEDIMTYEDITFLVNVLTAMGVEKVRFTGGEPLIRPGFPNYLKEFCATFPDVKTAFTTNGSLLRKYHDDIVSSKLNRINISLDTLSPEKFSQITRTGDLETVLDGIKLFSGLKKFNLRINTVVIKDFNDDEIKDIIEFSLENNILPRFIEFMPLDDDIWSGNCYVSADHILDSLPEKDHWEPMIMDQEISPGPAKYYYNSKSKQKLGIIAAVSHHFCNECNRLRVTALGEMRPCLFSDKGISLIEAIRNRDTLELKKRIIMAVEQKPSGWDSSEGHACHMSRIGG